MNSHSNLDQDDVLDLLERQRAEVGQLENQLRAAGRTVPARPQPDNEGDSLHEVELLRAHIPRLQQALGTSAPTTPAAKPTPKPTTAPKASAEPAKAETVTERCRREAALAEPSNWAPLVKALAKAGPVNVTELCRKADRKKQS